MQTVRIFIASSFEMSDWREAIGDAIRQWSDKFEPEGYRVRMECWEDYHPEYYGHKNEASNGVNVGRWLNWLTASVMRG